MTEFCEKLSNKIINSEGYLKAKQSLFASYVAEMIGETKNIDSVTIKKLTSAAQIFYKSQDTHFENEGAILLSMLLDLYASDYPALVSIANSIFANCGDFPNIHLLLKRHPEIDFQYSFYSHAQIDFKKDLNTVDEVPFTLTDFQRTLWEDLISEKDVITSAPTSAGKTHIILNYLIERVINSTGAFAVVIVPTRALITEVASKVYDLVNERNAGNEIEICTVPKEGAFKAKTFFIMTQERLHEVLLRGDVNFDYLFIDEAQNITDESRGVLLHITIEKILEDSYPQIIISMPSPSYQNSFSGIFRDVEFQKEITKHSPVAKILMNVTPKGKNLEISLHDSDSLVTLPKGFKGTDLADIVVRLGSGQSNIIYRNKTNECESVADKIASILSQSVPNQVSSGPLEEAADYVEKFIHQEYTLASNLRKGVAFHYGPLPGSIRVMVENLVKDDQVKYVACTSTLAEGVNLPAKNLFLKNPLQIIPMQASERVEDVKINNITGRAGRMLQHFSGNIFLIEPEDWNFKDYFEEDAENEDKKVPTYFKSLNDEFQNVISALEGTYSHNEKDQYKHYSIANKLLREFGSNVIDNTLSAEELTLNLTQRNMLLGSVELAHSNLKVAAFTLEANPTVGYIQQNKLYVFLSEQPNMDEWTLPHPKSSKLYDSLLKICSLLNELGVYIPSEAYTIDYLCVITKKWIQGDSLKEIISEQINWNNRFDPTKSVNAAVRDVIKAINSDIRFRLCNALRCYQLILNNVLAEKGLDLSNVKIHSYIEVGSCDERVISLINLGLSREAAIEIDHLLSKDIEIRSYTDLVNLLEADLLSGTHNITKKELMTLIK